MQNKYELAQRVIEHFIKEGKTLSTAESCTGGGIGQALTSVSGSSAAYGYGIISYSNEAKESVLNVPHAVLEQYGAVSQETADAMCRGAKALSGADVAVAVTGIAGPGGGSEEKPVGLVYIGCIDANDRVEVEKHIFSGERDEVREQTIEAALKLVLKISGAKTDE